MNPRESLEEADTATARAFVQMFQKYGDLLQFAIDPRVDDDEEVRASLSQSDNSLDGRSSIRVTAINEKTRFDNLRTGLEQMDVKIRETGEKTQHHESIGEYTAYFLTAEASHDPDTDWNVPHLVVYGSLTPELEDACYAAFGDAYTYSNIRNHYLVFGDGLENRDRDTLVDAIRSSESFFQEEATDYISDVRTATYL